MIKRLGGSLEKFYQNWPITFSSIIAVTILYLDYITGRPIHFQLLHILPVAFLAWKKCNWTACIYAVILPATRIYFYFLWKKEQPFIYYIINTIITIIVLEFLILLIARIVIQKDLLEHKIAVLEGILPICSVCKKIRDEKGHYEAIEAYIIKHSKAVFSHGLCPKCAREFYPEYFQDKTANDDIESTCSTPEQRNGDSKAEFGKKGKEKNGDSVGN